MGNSKWTHPNRPPGSTTAFGGAANDLEDRK